MHWIDPDNLPETTGTVSRFLINPRGEADGLLLLDDGTEVHVPPHLSTAIRASVKSGESVTIQGVRPRRAAMIAAVALTSSDGTRIVDNGPPSDDEKHARKEAAKAERRPLAVTGTVSRVLHGPKGEARGMLLDDGSIVRLPPPAAEIFADLMRPGQALAVRGEGLSNDLGTVVEAHEMGSSAEDLRAVEHRKPGKPDKHPKDAPKPRHAA